MIALPVILFVLTGLLFVMAMLKAANHLDGKNWRNVHPLDNQKLKPRRKLINRLDGKSLYRD